jgi:dolichol-phosphate mannosyltransferase
MQKVLISVISPVYNEEKLLPEFFQRVCGVLNEQTENWEVILINDGSIDGSLQRMRDFCISEPRVKVLNFSRNFGHQIAITAGLDHASGEANIIMDSDLQDPPELISKMVELWKQGNDVVYAVRQKREGDTLSKRITAGMFYRLMTRIARINLPVDVGDFRLLSRRAVLSLREIRESNRFLRGLITWMGYPQAGVPFVRGARKGGETKYSWTKMIRFAFDAIASFSYAPLRLATYAGLFALLVCFAFLLRMLFGGDAGEHTILLVALLFFGSLQLIALGMLGEYVGRIHDEVRRRPLYFIQERINL